MRRLAILFSILVGVSIVENALLQTAWTCPRGAVRNAQSRVRGAWMNLSAWRAFLIGPLRIFQRTVSRGAGPWLGQGN
jgi:hypothetical protein